MPLKICHLDTERSWRGGEQQILYLAEGLRAAGDSNLIAAREGSALAARAQGGNFELLPLRPWSEWDPVSAFILRRVLLKGGYQILHAHTAHAAALGALATLGTDIPLIVSRRVDFQLSQNPLTRWKYGRAAKVITVSSAIRQVLIQDGIPEESIAVVRSGIDAEAVQRNAGAGPREDFGLPADGPLIGQIAALAPHKDPFNFLQAVSILRKGDSGLSGIMVGAGPLEEDVKSEVRRLGLEGAVRLLGFREDARGILRHFSVFVLSSYLEGLGTSVLDAMALGVPVVATNTGGIPEMVEDGVSGLLVPPRDPRALAEAVRRVLRDAPLRETLRRGGYRAVKRFGVGAMVEATRKVYEQALRHP